MAMYDQHLAAVSAALDRLREVRQEFGDMHIGVALIHLDAAIAALETQLDQFDKPAG